MHDIVFIIVKLLLSEGRRVNDCDPWTPCADAN